MDSFMIYDNVAGGAELGGPRGPVPLHLFRIYVVKILKFRKIYFFYFFVPLHKKFASAHPVRKFGFCVVWEVLHYHSCPEK